MLKSSPPLRFAQIFHPTCRGSWGHACAQGRRFEVGEEGVGLSRLDTHLACAEPVKETKRKPLAFFILAQRGKTHCGLRRPGSRVPLLASPNRGKMNMPSLSVPGANGGLRLKGCRYNGSAVISCSTGSEGRCVACTNRLRLEKKRSRSAARSERSTT
jgi:hypothetical protein